MSNILAEDAKRITEHNINWEKLKGSSVLVTGASGMLGSYIVRTLVYLRNSRGWDIDVCALVRHPDKLPADIREEVTVLQQDVTESIKSETGFDYVIHAASPASPLIMKKDPAGTIAANVIGTYNTLQQAVRSGAKGYLFISSREIYGQPYEGQTEFTENIYGFVDPLSPRSCYPEGKKAAETMCAAYAEQYGLNARIARLAHTYGPGMSLDDGRVQADFFRDVVNHRDIVMKSEGLPVRTYTYVSDAVAALFYILLEAKEMAYNISSPESTVSIKQLAETAAGAFPERGLKVVKDIPEAAGNTGVAPFTLGILNSDKLRRLGWHPDYTLTEGIRRTVRYFEEK